MKNNTSSGSNVHYKLPFKFGLGGGFLPFGIEDFFAGLSSHASLLEDNGRYATLAA